MNEWRTNLLERKQVGDRRTSSLILMEKASRWNADKEIQALLEGINADDGSLSLFLGGCSTKTANDLKEYRLARPALGRREMEHERLDQQTVEVL